MTYPVGSSSPKLNSNKKGYVKSERKIIPLKKPGEISEDPLTDLLRTGARQLIAQAVEAELLGFLQEFATCTDASGRRQMHPILGVSWKLQKTPLPDKKDEKNWNSKISTNSAAGHSQLFLGREVRREISYR
jgi:hypothetical protein